MCLSPSSTSKKRGRCPGRRPSLEDGEPSRYGPRSRAPMTKTINWNYLILLTDLLTPDLDEPGCNWIRQPSAAPASRPIRQVRTGLDNPNLATDSDDQAIQQPPVQIRPTRQGSSG